MNFQNLPQDLPLVKLPDYLNSIMIDDINPGTILDATLWVSILIYYDYLITIMRTYYILT